LLLAELGLDAEPDQTGKANDEGRDERGDARGERLPAEALDLLGRPAPPPQVLKIEFDLSRIFFLQPE
jgi:hypothetical protein